MKREIHLQWVLHYPPEDVWECLTEAELIGQWLMKNDFKAEVGHRFQFRHKPRKGFGWDGIVYCEVLEIIPQQKLSFSWKGGPGDGSLTLDSVVTWTLKPCSEGTILTLRHAGFRGFRGYISSLFMKKGWAGHIIRKFTNILSERANAQL